MAYNYGYHVIRGSRRRRSGKGNWGGGGVGLGDLILTVLVFSAIMIVLIYMQSLLKESTEPNGNDVFYITSATTEKIELNAINREKTTTIDATEFEKSEDAGFFVMYNSDTKKYSTVLINDVVECLKKRE